MLNSLNGKFLYNVLNSKATPKGKPVKCVGLIVPPNF